MSRLIKSFILSVPLVLGTQTLAHARGLDSTISAPHTTAVKLEVALSEDLAHRANNLPDKLSDRGSSSRFRSGFSQNGYYGEKDLARLQQRLENRLLAQLEKRGVNVSDSAPTVLKVTLTDAKNNKPTFKQLSKEPGLSQRSFGTGGAEFDAELLSSNGTSFGTMNYDWFETDIRDSHFGGIWTDANRAIDRFAKSAAKELAKDTRS